MTEFWTVSDPDLGVITAMVTRLDRHHVVIESTSAAASEIEGVFL